MPSLEITIKLGDVNWEQYDDALIVLKELIDKIPAKQVEVRKVDDSTTD